MLSFSKKMCSAMSASVSLVRTPFWHMRKNLVLWKCPRHSKTLRSASAFLCFHWTVNTFKTPEICLYLDSDAWVACFTIIFAGSFHHFEPVSCWFYENVAGVPRPLDQLPSRVGKVNTFKTPEMRLYFDSGVWGGCLTIIFVGSFPYFKFLTKINSKVRRK